MPLLDHFHPPLAGARHWESFHARWASAMADRLDRDWLPKDYFVEIQVHVGGRIEVDVGAFESDHPSRGDRGPGESSSSVATLTVPTKVWTPPAPDSTFPAIFPDVIEVLVFHGESGPTLVGAVELVSPGNKDRPEARRAFAAKCASYIQDGIGLTVIDIVTSRHANMHDELVDLLRLGESHRMPGDSPVYATAYRPYRRRTEEGVDVWMAGLAVGEPLPTLPLALRGGPCLPIELEATYAEVCRRTRIA